MEGKLEEMRRKIMEKVGLSPVVREDLLDIVRAATREAATAAAEEAARVATSAAREEERKLREADRCRCSIIIHNAHRWVSQIQNGHTMAENIMAQIHRFMAHTVLVMDAFAIGPPPASLSPLDRWPRRPLSSRY
jgi:hypothetical protein